MSNRLRLVALGAMAKAPRTISGAGRHFHTSRPQESSGLR